MAAELFATAVMLSSTLFDPADAVNTCAASIVTFCQRFASAYNPDDAVIDSAGIATPVFTPRISIFRNSLDCGHCARYIPQVCVECAPVYDDANASVPTVAIFRFSISATRNPLPPLPVAACIAIAQLPTHHPAPVPTVPVNPFPPDEKIDPLSIGRLTAQLPAGASPFAVAHDTSSL